MARWTDHRISEVSLLQAPGFCAVLRCGRVTPNFFKQLPDVRRSAVQLGSNQRRYA